MPDHIFTAAVQELRKAIEEIRQDVRRIEEKIAEPKPRKWWHF